MRIKGQVIKSIDNLGYVIHGIVDGATFVVEMPPALMQFTPQIGDWVDVVFTNEYSNGIKLHIEPHVVMQKKDNRW